MSQRDIQEKAGMIKRLTAFAAKNRGYITGGLALAVMAAWLVAPDFAFAAGAGAIPNGDVSSGSTGLDTSGNYGAKTIQSIATLVVHIVFGLIGVISVVLLVIRGFALATAGGNPNKRQDAMSGVMWACIGIAVALGAELFANVIAGMITSIAGGK